jgi:hypothetical protein
LRRERERERGRGSSRTVPRSDRRRRTRRREASRRGDIYHNNEEEAPKGEVAEVDQQKEEEVTWCGAGPIKRFVATCTPSLRGENLRFVEVKMPWASKDHQSIFPSYMGVYFHHRLYNKKGPFSSLVAKRQGKKLLLAMNGAPKAAENIVHE